VCLDAGASTGGFTDRLLQGGAASVVAVDVGYGQLDWQLRSDPRVRVLERTNVRDLRPQSLGAAPHLVVADLSFMALRTVLPHLVGLAAPDAAVVLLVKPQFEADRSEVETGGVVRDPAVRRRCLERVVQAARGLGIGALGAMASPIRGPAGNVEYFVWGHRGAPGGEPDVASAVAEGEALS
jgi:23S rRNA (cytidine1920-2'-O)/16S rRNA (cytidine1409-2'-O)-methyltransferase